MESTHTRRLRPTTPTPPSPRLLRSRSGAPPSESRTCNNNTLNSINRSKSTTRSRNQTQNKNEDYVTPSTILASMQQKKNKECSSLNKDGFVRFLQRGTSQRNNNYSVVKKSTKSFTSSPSAWALSPGRSSPCMVAPADSPLPVARRAKSSGGGGGVSGVLKYFRQKKVSPVQEEEYHRFRVLHNTLIQYRFANARAEATMGSLKNVSEDRIFSGWVRVVKMRNSILEKRIQVQKLKHEIKLCQIVNPQIRLLNEWAKLEGKNCEAVGGVIRKLSALSVKLPFEDAKANVESIYEAMNIALAVTDGIEATVKKFLPQAEKILYMLTELITTVEHEEEYLKELDTIFPLVPSLMETEKYLRVHLLQAAEESKRSYSEGVKKYQIC